MAEPMVSNSQDSEFMNPSNPQSQSPGIRLYNEFRPEFAQYGSDYNRNKDLILTYGRLRGDPSVHYWCCLIFNIEGYLVTAFGERRGYNILGFMSSIIFSDDEIVIPESNCQLLFFRDYYIELVDFPKFRCFGIYKNGDIYSIEREPPEISIYSSDFIYQRCLLRYKMQGEAHQSLVIQGDWMVVLTNYNPIGHTSIVKFCLKTETELQRLTIPPKVSKWLDSTKCCMDIFGNVLIHTSPNTIYGFCVLLPDDSVKCYKFEDPSRNTPTPTGFFITDYNMLIFVQCFRISTYSIDC